MPIIFFENEVTLLLHTKLSGEYVYFVISNYVVILKISSCFRFGK